MEVTVMTRLLQILVVGLLLGMGGLPGTAGEPRKPDELMRRKLAEAQKVLEAIALQNFDDIASHAEELIEISKEVRWKVLDTPLYQRYSSEFRDTAGELVKHARKKNLDGAALSYVDLTLTCVKCHKHVREKKMVRAD
jgi:hypothetical protein